MIDHTCDYKTLKADLGEMGIRPGDILIVHSSMKSIGRVEGGPQTVIRALQDAVTPKGTLLMPAFSYCVEKVYSAAEPFSLRASPSEAGLLTEVFRKTKGVIRSGHPTHSVSAWGRLARSLTAGHEKMSGVGADSPFGRASREGAKVCLIGCGFTSLSLLHVAEAVAESPYLRIFCWAHLGWKPGALIAGKNGKAVPVKYPSVPGCGRSFGRAQVLAERRRLLRRGRLGGATALVFKAADVLGATVAELKRRPDYLLCPASTCRSCDERRSIFEVARLKPHAAAGANAIIDIVCQAGIRMAGSPSERKAAEIIAGRMSEIGLANVQVQEFPVMRCEPGCSTVRVRRGGRWEETPSAPVAHSPATGRRGVSGTAVLLESMTDLSKLRNAKSSIGVLLDGYGASAAKFRRLMERGFRGFIYLDRRFDHNDLVAVGVPAQWLRHFKVPMVSVPHAAAMRIFGQGPVPCRMSLDSRNTPSTSTNVIGDIPGREPGAILVTAHHDSTFNSAAPDDNLSGVAAMLQIAAALKAGPRPRRTIRFCSFGAEEQLSEGARHYALESGQAKGVQFVVNSDSIGARVGTTRIHVTGHAAVAEWVQGFVRRSPLQFKVIEDLSPFSDQFPFNAAGVPSLSFYRVTMSTGRHYHHTVRDALAELSFDGIAQLADFQTGLIRQLAFAKRFPFPTRLTGRLRQRLAEAARQYL